MPMETTASFGTNNDGSRNEDYCTYCYQKGRFTDPDITVDQMIAKCVGMTRQLNIPESQFKQIIPTLKRWRKIKK